MSDFEKKIIVVTGASGNLGKAVVRGFLNKSGIVCGIYYHQPPEEELVEMSGSQGVFHSFTGVDLTDREGVKKLADQIRNDIGVVEAVINTVGGFMMGERVDQMKSETWNQMLSVNVNTMLNSAAAFVPMMVELQRGKFITIGSRSASTGGAKTGAYAAAKSAVLRLTESMAAELKSSGIQANCVLPGTIDTPENREAMPNADFAKWVTPEQIAEVILFLASSNADAITGAGIPVSGRS